MQRAVVRRKGQITLPQEVRDALHVEQGDSVAFTLTGEGTVVLSGLKSIPAEQAWFWTEQWQAGEREASRQAARGEGTIYESAKDFEDSLD
jgi:AbrB family looped-hinge helix DNA binding protein